MGICSIISQWRKYKRPPSNLKYQRIYSKFVVALRKWHFVVQGWTMWNINVQIWNSNAQKIEFTENRQCRCHYRHFQQTKVVEHFQKAQSCKNSVPLNLQKTPLWQTMVAHSGNQFGIGKHTRKMLQFSKCTKSTLVQREKKS